MTGALLFPGQGSQNVGMGRDLANNFACARAVFDEVNDALSKSLTTIMWDGPKEKLTLTENTQPALMAVSMAVMAVLIEEKGFSLEKSVRYVAGHSLGEYAALAATGALSLGDTARLLQIRGKAMQDAVPVGEGAMTVLLGVGIDVGRKVADQAADGEVCEVANDNEARQVVLSGHKSAIERAMKIAPEHGVRRAMPLPVSAPFHCSLMQPAADVMAEALADVEIAKPAVPLVANVLAAPIDEPQTIRQKLIDQVTGTVRWRETMAFMVADGVDNFFEIGTGKVLTGLVGRVDKNLPALPVGDTTGIEKMMATLQD